MTANRSPAKRRGPSLEAIRNLLAFHDCGGVSAAARELGDHQPVVTRRLKIFKTERVCGKKLLHGSGKTLALTDDAKAVLPAMRQLIGQYDRILEYIAAEAPTSKVLHLGCGTFTASQGLPKFVVQFQRDYPDVELEIRIDRGKRRILKTADGTFDLAVVTHTPQQIRNVLKDAEHPASVLSVEELRQYDLAAIAHQKTPAGLDLKTYAPNRPLEARELKSYLPQWELIGLDRDSGIRQQLEAACRPSAELYFAVEGGGWDAAREYARLQVGVAILPEALLTSADRKTFVIRRLGKAFAISERLIWRKNSRDESLNNALQLLRNTFQES